MKIVIRLLLWAILIVNAIALIVTLLEMWPENPLNEYKILLVVSFITISGFLRLALKEKRKEPLAE